MPPTTQNRSSTPSPERIAELITYLPSCEDALKELERTLVLAIGEMETAA